LFFIEPPLNYFYFFILFLSQDRFKPQADLKLSGFIWLALSASQAGRQNCFLAAGK